MVKMTKIEVELIPDSDMYIFFEKGRRGRLSFICVRYSKANNKCSKSYETEQESKHIMNLDDNNLYGYAMSKFLPTSGFKWIDPKNLTWKNIEAIIQKDVFSKLILNILRSYKNYAMFIL